jgi:hypothetical protein
MPLLSFPCSNPGAAQSALAWGVKHPSLTCRSLGITDEGLLKLFDNWDPVEFANPSNASPKAARKWGYLLPGMLRLSGINLLQLCCAFWA